MPDVVLYQVPRPRVALLTLNRPDARNAQDTRLLYDLNAAFDRAARDEDIRVIVLAANGPDFSAGHDLRETDHLEHLRAHQPVGTWCGFGCEAAEGVMSRERELYLGLCERWRNLPKPTIAAVQGRCIAGGLMLVWPCDLVVAAEDARFMDSTVNLGVGGVEFFAHPYELGARKAKELLFTADWLSAADALRLGMVNQVVPTAELGARALELAERIAQKPAFALKLAKEAVNAAQDASGRQAAMATAFALHQLAHSHNYQVHGLAIDPGGFPAALTRPKP
jgi:enoyl-CoA hydratase